MGAQIDDLAQSFFGEGAIIPAKQSLFGSTYLSRYIIGIVTCATEELLDTADEDLFPLITDLDRMDSSLMLDSYVPNPTNAAVVGIRPSSLLYNATTQASLDDPFQDIAHLLGRLMARKPSKPCIIFSTTRRHRLWIMKDEPGWILRDELSRNEIGGVKLIHGAKVPEGWILSIDLGDLVKWLPPAIVNTLATATIIMANDDGNAPTMASARLPVGAGPVLLLSLQGPQRGAWAHGRLYPDK